jgi:hypothetical protein
MKKPVAVLSTTVLPIDGVYMVKTVDPDTVDIEGVLHFVGHPATKAIVEKKGAVPSSNFLFKGLQKGECAVCFSIAQGKSSRSTAGFTVHQNVTASDLVCRVVTRIE